MSKDIEMEASEKLAIGKRVIEVGHFLKIKQTGIKGVEKGPLF